MPYAHKTYKDFGFCLAKCPSETLDTYKKNLCSESEVFLVFFPRSKNAPKTIFKKCWKCLTTPTNDQQKCQKDAKQSGNDSDASPAAGSDTSSSPPAPPAMPAVPTEQPPSLLLGQKALLRCCGAVVLVRCFY